MKKGGQVGAELHGQSEWEFGGQVDGIIQVVHGRFITMETVQLVIGIYLILRLTYWVMCG